MVETFGYGSREEVFTVPVSSFYAFPEERSEFLRLVERDGYVKEHPLCFRKKDGTIINGLITIVPQKYLDGSLKGFIGTVHDITGKKRIYEPLPGLEPFNKSRAENKADYIVVYGEDGTILYANPATARTLGYDADTITGTSLFAYVAENCRDMAAAKMAERNVAGEIPMYEIDIITRDGLRRSVIVKGTRVEFEKNPATLLLFIDITRRKELEDQLIARATDLSQISTAFQRSIQKLNLLSTVTRHDINNQLMVQVGYLEMIEETELDPLQREYFEMVKATAGRISAMILFTKEYEEIGVYAPAWEDCRRLVDRAVKEVVLRQVRIFNGIPVGAEILADPLVFRVFYNLMDNAMRYGGRITYIRFSTEKRGNDLVIICEDDGVGIPVDEKGKIFERGFGKNTGLGLFLSKEILSITGITITETGEPGYGARFEIIVPEEMNRNGNVK